MTLKTNLNQVTKRSAAAFARLSRNAPESVEPLVEDLVEDTRTRGKGRFKTDVDYEKTEDGFKIGGTEPRDFIWRFLEFGTVKMLPQPFVRPAIAANRHRLKTGAVRELRKLAKKVF